MWVYIFSPDLFLIMMMMTMRMIADDTLSRDYRHTLDVLLIGRAEHTWIEAQRSIGDVIIGPHPISAQILYVHARLQKHMLFKPISLEEIHI